MTVRTQYEADLTALKAALVEMGQNSANAVEAALEALCTADAEAAAAIVKGDGRINNMERDIEHRCMTLLLRQQPVAGDLRRISTAIKVVTDIERMGDHAADIAEIIPHLVTVRRDGDPAVSQAIRMGQKAQSAQPVIDTDHKYAFCCQGPSMVEFLIPQTSLETAAVNPKQHRPFGGGVAALGPQVQILAVLRAGPEPVGNHHLAGGHGL